MNNKVDESKKSARLTALQKLQRGITLKKNKKLEGTEELILVEGQSKKGGQLTGRTGTNKIVNLDSNKEIIGDLIKVKIKHSFLNSLWGEPPDSDCQGLSLGAHNG
jgi:tRNA-2-methylthio-N6-dimethylallyladenosine synthase